MRKEVKMPSRFRAVPMAVPKWGLHPYLMCLGGWGPNGSYYNYIRGAHGLTAFNDPLPQQHVDQAMKGTWRFALYEEQKALFLLSENDLWHWAEAPFCWHRNPVGLRGTPDQLDLHRGEEVPLLVSLVDRTTGRLTARHVFVLPADFSAALHAAIKRQAMTVITEAEHDAAIERTFDRFPTADGMAEVATAQCAVKSRGGVR